MNFSRRRTRRYYVRRPRTWTKPKTVKNPNGCVYLICFASPEITAFKIGVTHQDHVIKRLKQLQTGCPWRLQIAKVMYRPDAYEFEAFLHRKFARYRIRQDGEWFDMGPGVDGVAEVIRQVPV